MPLLDIARDVKAGKLKISQVRPGIQAAVKRLIPVLGEKAPKVTYTTRGERGDRFRRARST